LTKKRYYGNVCLISERPPLWVGLSKKKEDSNMKRYSPHMRELIRQLRQEIDMQCDRTVTRNRCFNLLDKLNDDIYSVGMQEKSYEEEVKELNDQLDESHSKYEAAVRVIQMQDKLIMVLKKKVEPWKYGDYKGDFLHSLNLSPFWKRDDPPPDANEEAIDIRADHKRLLAENKRLNDLVNTFFCEDEEDKISAPGREKLEQSVRDAAEVIQNLQGQVAKLEKMVDKRNHVLRDVISDYRELTVNLASLSEQERSFIREEIDPVLAKLKGFRSTKE
jgi:hypothetical protein